MESEHIIAAPSYPEAVDGAADDAMARRTFLQWVSAACATSIGALVGIPAVRAALSPAAAKPLDKDWVKVADDTALLDIGVPVRLDFAQTQTDAWVESRAMNSVWLFTSDGDTFKAYNGHCTHLGCGYTYDKDAKHFICPCHRGQFDVKTGAVLAGPPPRPLDELEVQVRDAAVYVKYKDFRLGVAEKVEA